MQASPVEGQSLKQKEKKRRKRKSKKKIPKIEKPKNVHVGRFLIQKLSQNFDFCAYPSHNVLNRDASRKKGRLLWCKCIFNWIKANLAEIQPENHQNVQKIHF